MSSFLKPKVVKLTKGCTAMDFGAKDLTQSCDKIAKKEREEGHVF